jgi:DNA polymerase-3 subunit gamma/tau
MSEPLHIKYRPKKLEDVAGNKGAVATVKSFLERELIDMPHSWLFSGPSGTGKTTIARIVAHELGCSDIDFIEYNSGSMRGVDSIRDIEQKSKLSPMKGKVKVYLFDEVHNWTAAAQEASLKLLEDAPKNVFFFLATTNPEKLRKAVRTRCTDIAVKALNTKDISALIRRICEEEGIGDMPKEVIQKIASSCDGSPREAVKMLDAVIDIEELDEALEAISAVYTAETEIIDLCRALTQGHSWNKISPILKNLEGDPENARRAILGYFTKVLLDKGDLRIAEMMEQFESNYYDTGKAGLVLSCFAATQV